MEIKQLILKEIDSIPEEKLIEVLDFIQSIESRLPDENLGSTFMSESSLSKDWLKSEEDDAWKNL